MFRLLSFLLLLFAGTNTFAQLTGTKSIPGNYTTIAAAISDLNIQGVGTGGVIFNIAAGYTETAPAGGMLLTATGTATNPIVFQKSGNGANPKITSTDAGTIATSVLGGQGDAVFIIQGSDYVSLNGIDVAASQSGIEYGYYIRKASGTNGCKNVSITYAAVTLTKGSSAYVIGIYASNNSSTSVASSAAGIAVTAISGTNENITFSGDTISNVFTGIAVIGYNAGSPYSLYDQNFNIGNLEPGNTIQNFAGNTAATAYGVYMLYVKNVIASNNTISNAAGNGTAATSTLAGIYFDTNASGAGDYVASNNTFNLSQASTAALTFIYNASTVNSFTVTNNSFASGSFASTANSYLIYHYSVTPTVNISNNKTIGTITKSGAGSFYGINSSGGGPVGGNLTTCSGNNFSNISLNGGNSFYGILINPIVNNTYVITNNIVSNISGGNVFYMYGIIASYGYTNCVVSGNIVNSLSGAINTYGIIVNIYTGQTMPVNVFQNTISNITGSDVIYGLSYEGMYSANVYKNKIYNLTATSNTGSIYGISCTGITSAVHVSIYNNLVGNLNTPAVNSLSDVIRGLAISNGNIDVYYNTVYLNATTSGANLSTTAIYHIANNNPAAGVLNLRNNILVNISTAKGSGTTVVLRRSGASLNNYGTTSNNNLVYAGTPSASNLIYFDGLNFAQTLADFKAQMAPRESASVTEQPPFISTVGSDANYLHIASGASTQANNGGAPITGITDDYDSQSRSTTTPDIGADEFDMALPITVEYLKGKQAGSGNALNWKVSCTSASIIMELERSSDSRSFNHIVSRITATQARCGQPFDYTDNAPVKGTNYYRLKMIDVDGKITYSPVVAILNGKAGAELVGIYPTIVQDQAFVSVTASHGTTMQLTISDMSGKVIRSFNQTIFSGSSLIPVNTSKLATGVYNIAGMLNGSRTQIVRFVKQ